MYIAVTHIINLPLGSPTKPKLKNKWNFWWLRGKFLRIFWSISEHKSQNREHKEHKGASAASISRAVEHQQRASAEIFGASPELPGASQAGA